MPKAADREKTSGAGATGALAELADLALIMPKDEIYRIQEDHLAVYHLLCAVVEYELFDM